MTNDLNPQLVIRRGASEVSTILLDRPKITFGRSPECEVMFFDTIVSRRHAEVRKEGEKFRILDLGSLNKTFVNTVLVSERGQILRDGDYVTLGQGRNAVAMLYTTTIPSTEQQKPSPDLLIDETTRDVWVNGVQIVPPLSNTEFNLLNYLYQHRGKLCTRDDIARNVWAQDAVAGTSNQNMDQVISSVRSRIGDSQKKYILTRYGQGYILV